MYQCLNCGSGLTFDIASQRMLCDSCQSSFEPYALNADIFNGAGQNDYYNVNTFTCPHCGGEIYSTDNSAAEFCSFCGASTILTSRLSREKRPDYIIPFKITKEQCKESYKRFVGRSFFAPKEFKNPKYIDSFRGIYMPYWAYHIEQKGLGSLKGTQIIDNSDSISRDTYKLSFNVDNYYKGLSYDASSSFYDNVSSSIAPFNVRGMHKFHPALLSGFYADAADIPSSTYVNDAKDYCNNATLSYLSTNYLFRNINISMPDSLLERSAIFHTNIKEINSAMYPVWFMSYRRGKRVAYVVVNGQTGKTFADFPISVAKYLLCSLFIAIPLFLLFYNFFSFSANFTLVLTSISALLSSIIYAVEITQIAKKDTMADDRGHMYKQKKKAYKPLKARKIRQKFRIGFACLYVISMIVCFGIIFGIFSSDIKIPAFIQPLIISFSLIGTIASAIAGTHTPRKLKSNVKTFGFIFSIIALIVSLAITIVNPPSILLYYAAMLISLMMVLILNLSIIFKYNELATRKLPQFDPKGGNCNV